MGFEIRGQRAFDDCLCRIFGGVAFAHDESEILYGARFQIAQSRAGGFAQHSGIKLLAFSCSNQQQSRRFQACRRVNEGELQHLAGKLSALGQPTQQPSSRPIDLRDAALNRVGLLKHIRN